MGESAAEAGSRDLYAILCVSSHATDDEIKAAFRKLAAKYHPDRNPNDPRAATRFKRVNAAYQVLIDPVKRRDYDDLTRPIEDDDAPPSVKRAPKREDPKRDAPKREPSRSQQPPEPRPSNVPPPERELLRDNRVVVTDRRVVLPNAEYSLQSLSGARLVSYERNHFILLMVVLAFVVVFVGAVSDAGRWPYVASVGLIGILIRYTTFTPKYFVRLCTDGGIEFDAAQSLSAAWASDVVRCIEDVVARTSPSYRGKRAAAFTSSGAQLGEAFAMCVAMLFSTYVVSLIFPTEKHATAAEDTSTQPTPRTPPTSTPQAPQTEDYRVQPGESWGSIASTIGLSAHELAELNEVTVDTTIHPNTVLQVPTGANAKLRQSRPQPTIRPPPQPIAPAAFASRLSSDEELTINMACNRFQMEGDVANYQQCRTATRINAGEPAPSLSGFDSDIRLTIQMACSKYQMAGDLRSYRNCIRQKVAEVR